MRNPRDFFKPLAIDAPEPAREIPFKPSRMIHFLDFSNEKMVAKVPDIAPQVDILLGNLEDAVPLDCKEAARAGLIRVGREMELGDTALWTRVNELASPYVLDDLTQIVTEIGDRIEVIMVPKVEGPWDIHYVDRLLAQLEARAGVQRPILVHAVLETHLGVANLEEIAAASPRIQGMSFGPADLAASRRMKTTRVGGGHIECEGIKLRYLNSSLRVLPALNLTTFDGGHQTRSNFNSPSFSRLQATLSPGLSQTRSAGGRPAITPSGVPVKMMSPGLSVM